MVFSGLHMLTNNLKYVIWMLAGRYHGLIAQNKHANETGPGNWQKGLKPQNGHVQSNYKRICMIVVYIYNHPEVDRISGISKKKTVRKKPIDRIPKWLKNPGRWLVKKRSLKNDHKSGHLACDLVVLGLLEWPPNVVNYAGVLGSGMQISAQNLPKKLSLLLVVPRNLDPLAVVFNSQIQERNGCGSNYHTPKLIVDFLRCEILKFSWGQIWPVPI